MACWGLNGSARHLFCWCYLKTFDANSNKNCSMNCFGFDVSNFGLYIYLCKFSKNAGCINQLCQLLCKRKLLKFFRRRFAVSSCAFSYEFALGMASLRVVALLFTPVLLISAKKMYFTSTINSYFFNSTILRIYFRTTLTVCIFLLYFYTIF